MNAFAHNCPLDSKLLNDLRSHLVASEYLPKFISHYLMSNALSVLKATALVIFIYRVMAHQCTL